ncbi:MAG: hypothetical protein ACK4SO_05650, partial [Candidatus Kapaibacteriota bacterium]
MKKLVYIAFLFSIYLTTNYIYAQDEKILISSLKKELARFLQKLSTEQYPPYYLSYIVFDIETATVSNSFGRTATKNNSRNRILNIDLRVGNYTLDNTHKVDIDAFSFSSFQNTKLPLKGDEKALRTSIWNATEKAYKDAMKQYQSVLSSRALKVKEEDTSADFTQEIPPTIYFEPRETFTIDLDRWERIF